MTIDVTWYDEDQTILHIQYHSQWTLEDFHQMLDQSHRMTDNGRSFVAIGDFSQSSMLPNSLLSTSRRIEQSTPPNRLMLILIQPNMLMQTLIRTVSKIYPKIFDNAQTVSTLDEAVAAAQKCLQDQKPQP